MRIGKTKAVITLSVRLDGNDLRELFAAALRGDQRLAEVASERHGWLRALCNQWCLKATGGTILHPLEDLLGRNSPMASARKRRTSVAHDLTPEQAEQAFDILSQPLEGNPPALGRLRDQLGEAADLLRDANESVLPPDDD